MRNEVLVGDVDFVGVIGKERNGDRGASGRQAANDRAVVSDRPGKRLVEVRRPERTQVQEAEEVAGSGPTNPRVQREFRSEHQGHQGIGVFRHGYRGRKVLGGQGAGRGGA